MSTGDRPFSPADIPPGSATDVFPIRQGAIMRAAVIHQQAPIEESPLVIDDLPVPTPGPGEVQLRVHSCGVCHTDLHIAEGDMPLVKKPLVPGHQIVGTITKIGEGVPGDRMGERVGVPLSGISRATLAFEPADES